MFLFYSLLHPKVVFNNVLFEHEQEIDELISGALTEEDDASIQAELDSLIADSLPDVQVPKEDSAAVSLPDVPTDEPSGKILVNFCE